MIDTDGLRTIIEITGKLLIGLALAGMIGWERELRHRPAGMRTHMLMMLGVILFAEASKVFSTNSPDRIAAQILTGVGFLGAGTIMRYGPEVRGLTSAASIWATAAIGVVVSVGGNFIVVGLVATLCAWFVLSILNKFEARVKNGGRTRTMHVNVQSQDALASILKGLAEAQITVESFKMLPSEAGMQLEMCVHGDAHKALEIVSGARGVNSAGFVAAAGKAES